MNFGKADRITWLDGPDVDVALVGEARLQHAFAMKIRARMKDKGYTASSYAEVAGVGYDRLSRVLRGEMPMKLRDIAAAEHFLGEILPSSFTG